MINNEYKNSSEVYKVQTFRTTQSLLFMLSASFVLKGDATSNLPCGLENPLAVRYPQLAQAAAPDWLVEGTRATYYVVSGTADSERDTSVEYGSGNSKFVRVTADTPDPFQLPDFWGTDG